jgi:1,4-alpha-glucan branching enzyme
MPGWGRRRFEYCAAGCLRAWFGRRNVIVKKEKLLFHLQVEEKPLSLLMELWLFLKNEIMGKEFKLITGDPWLAPYKGAIEGRHSYVVAKEAELTGGGKQTLSGFASGYLYFGLHRTAAGWVLREWAPNATAIYLVGTFNGWRKDEAFRFRAEGNGNWEITLPADALHHEDLYKLLVEWEGGGAGERIPAWCRRVVQDGQTKIFSAQVWEPPTPYVFKRKQFKPDTSPLLIYECHIGMATPDERTGTYEEFRTQVLPRIVGNGYNAIQIMAVQEHPYYGSFGYHVSSFFAASSRFGTPEELKHLIDDAHGLGIAVIMDIVHSHAVKNEIEGLGRFDGTPYQYFHAGDRREHRQWDSLCFNYGKNEVLHFLLSNCKFWLEEYRFDGFRFDGVTSMLYLSHGLGESFSNYGDYYNGGQDGDAIAYLTLANKLIHSVNPRAVTIAEEVSGMPGLAVKINDGGYGFDYRMAMNIPDFWIRTLKEKKDEEWRPSDIWRETTNRRSEEKTVSYAESHDQAMVGDKTLIFWLVDADMYWHMQVNDPNMTVDRGIALHKMIRLVTATTINGGYLNFMGNEFGHPEWIDFPREGNGWSYKYARRQWHLVDDANLKYHYLGDFDGAMLSLIRGVKNFQSTPLRKIWDNDGDQVLAYMRGDLLFVFNFNPRRSFTDYGFLTPAGSYRVALNTDEPRFGGFGLTDDALEHRTHFDPLFAAEKKEWLKLYLPARTAIVLKQI